MSALEVDPGWPLAARQAILGLVEEAGRLRDKGARLDDAVARRDRRIERFKKDRKRLQKKLEEALRAGKRQAGPFSKGAPKAKPKRSGRKAGPAHGPTNLRSPPDRVDLHRYAELPESCPCCGGSVTFDNLDCQYHWDLPDIQPIVTKFTIEVGHCGGKCGQRLQGRHPDQTSDALGSARCQIGPKTLAVVAHLNKVIGAPYAKIALFFKVAFHFVVAASTLVRGLLRLAKKVEPAYERIHALVRTSPVVYPDETGWRIRGVKAWLWVFVGIRPGGRKVVLYKIARYRGFSVAKWALGVKFSGMLGHDGWAPYDQFEDATHQTCLNHLLSRCKRMIESATRRALTFPRLLKAILQDAIRVRDRYLAGEVSYHGLQVARGLLEARLMNLLEMELSHAGNRRMAKHVRKHEDQVFTFLKHPDQIEATNCYAEQETRPAVIARKISGCNKSWEGAHAHEALVSYLRTAQHTGETGIEWLVAVQCARAPRGLSLPTFLGGP